MALIGKMSKVDMSLPDNWFRADGTVSGRERRSQLDRFVADHPLVAGQRRTIARIISDWDKRVSGQKWFTGFVRIASDHQGDTAQLVGEAQITPDAPLPVEIRLAAARRAGEHVDEEVSAVAVVEDVRVAAWRAVRVDRNRMEPMGRTDREPVERFTSTFYVPLVAPSGAAALRIRFLSGDLTAIPLLRSEIGQVVASLQPRFMQRYHQEDS